MMLLRVLYDLARDEQLIPDSDFEMRPVAWLIRIADGGRLLGIESTHQELPAQGRMRPKLVPKSFRVPRQPLGRSGTKAPAAFLVDNAKYVFGMSTADKAFSAEEGTEKATSFRALVAACATKTKDEGAQAVLAFLEAVASRTAPVQLPSECKSNDLFGFVYAADGDRLVHERPTVRSHWHELRTVARAAEGDSGQCLVTGKPAELAPLFPMIERVPGGRARTGLVSFNKSAFESHGWSQGQNAPISQEAAEACATALNRLLHPAYPNPHPASAGEPMPRRHVRLSADTAVCFWASASGATGFVDVIAPLIEAEDPELVGDAYRAIWRGRPVDLEDPSAFFALTLSGALARVIVRDWFESSVADVASNLVRHFRDLAIVRNTPPPKGRPLPAQLPLRVLLRSLAPRGRNEDEGVPPNLAARLAQAALRGTPYPMGILQRALQRTRAEIGRSEWGDFERRDARAALIKATLIRNTTHKELTATMDPSNTQAGYLLGRLIAVIERLQQEALGDINAGVVDRYFSAASATPRAVFTRLLKNARHHARKAKDDPSHAGAGRWLDGLIDEIAARFDPKHNGFPAHLDLEQQGLFVLGYHQQRHWLWQPKAERERQGQVEATA